MNIFGTFIYTHPQIYDREEFYLPEEFWLDWLLKYG
jgi:hypothetical protein